LSFTTLVFVRFVGLESSDHLSQLFVRIVKLFIIPNAGMSIAVAACLGVLDFAGLFPQNLTLKMAADRDCFCF
jgi:hypothetical protein